MNRDQIDSYVKNCLMLVTAHKEGANLRDTAIKLGLLSGEEFDKAVVPERMTRP